MPTPRVWELFEGYLATLDAMDGEEANDEEVLADPEFKANFDEMTKIPNWKAKRIIREMIKEHRTLPEIVEELRVNRWKSADAKKLIEEVRKEGVI